MSLRLQALFADVLLPLSDQPTVLGRSRNLQISSTSVSRHACSCFADGKAIAKVVASKRVYIMRKESRAVAQVDRDHTCQVVMRCSALHTFLTVAAQVISIAAMSTMRTILSITQVAIGDVIYLAVADPGQYQYGFQLLGPEPVSDARHEEHVQILCLHHCISDWFRHSIANACSAVPSNCGC